MTTPIRNITRSKVYANDSAQACFGDSVVNGGQTAVQTIQVFAWQEQAMAISFLVTAGLAYMDLYEAENMDNPVLVHAAFLLAVAQLGLTIFRWGF